MNIHKHLPSLSLLAGLLLVLCIPLPGFAGKNSTELMRVQPPDEEQLSLLPKNLARWHLGTRLILPDPEAGFNVYDFEQQRAVPKGAFLSDDETEGVPLDAGRHDVLVDLGDFLSISRFYCLSFGATGTLELRVSETLQDLSSPDWTQMGRLVPFGENTVIDLRFPLADVRYLWVRMDIETAGEMGSFGAMGLLTANEIEFVGTPMPTNAANEGLAMGSDEEEPPSDSFEIVRSSGQNKLVSEGLPFDYGKIYSGTSVAYLNSGDPSLANFLIDDDVLTYYEVPPSETEPVFIMRLPQETHVEYVSILMESGPGFMEVYFIDDLPFDDQTDESQIGDTARFWTLPGSGERLLLASNDPVLTAAIRFAQTSGFESVQVDESFFENLGVATRRRVPPDETRVRIPVLSQSSPFMMLRWVPDDVSTVGLRIFEVSVLGFVEPIERIVNYQTVPAASTAEFAALELDEDGNFDDGFEDTGDGGIDEGQQIIPDENPVSP